MKDEEVMVLKGADILSLFEGREHDILAAIRQSYQVHAQGKSTLPHSSFVRFPEMEKERIIALPAYLGGNFNVAGIKWIASFPENLTRNLERASAVLILNSMETGRPLAFLESSVISARRTAASAALAAQQLWLDETCTQVGLVGCGLINYETVRFLLAVYPDIEKLLLFDLSTERMIQFGQKCQQLRNDLQIEMAENIERVFNESPIVALATTAVTPHISQLPASPSGSLILHTSLRDLSPAIILQADNVVDDIDHVCRAQTSVHLAEQQVGHRKFIRCTLGDILNGEAAARVDEERVAVFSPFGMGVLDLALGQLALCLAQEEGIGLRVPSFLPEPWFSR